MSGNKIESLINEAQSAFDRKPGHVETGLQTKEGDLLQLRKSCQLLAGANVLLEQGFYTLVIEASFVSVERVIEFKLLESGRDPRDLPGTHPGVYTEAMRRGILSEEIAERVQDLWRNHRAKTYYQDGLATKERAESMFALATEIHLFVRNQSSKKYECLCT